MRSCIAFLACLIAVAPCFAQKPSSVRSHRDPAPRDSIRYSDVVWKEGTIVSLKPLRDKKLRLELQIEGKESEIFTLDYRTMIYQLTDRNRQIFKEKEQDKRRDVLKDINTRLRQLDQLPKQQFDVMATQWTRLYAGGTKRPEANRAVQLGRSQQAFAQEEEKRRNNYGPPVTLRPNMTTYDLRRFGHRQDRRAEARKDARPAKQIKRLLKPIALSPAHPFRT
jgi:hypothetical protein